MNGRLYGHKTRVMHIERKAGDLTGPTRIGRVTYSKTGATLYCGGKEFRSLKGAGFKANSYDVDSGEEYWISGPRKDGCDARIPRESLAVWCELGFGIVGAATESLGIAGLVVFRLAARNAQRLPLREAQVLGEEDDLSDVLRVVSERAVECPHDGVRLRADGHGAVHIFGAQRVQLSKYV